MRTFIAIVALCAFPQCAPPSPTPAPTPVPTPTAPPEAFDAGHVAAKYSAACANLRALGCPEGDDSACAAAMQHADKAHLTLVPTACLTTAHSKTEARSCTFVACP